MKTKMIGRTLDFFEDSLHENYKEYQEILELTKQVQIHTLNNLDHLSLSQFNLKQS
jgi:hypothetical protein